MGRALSLERGTGARDTTAHLCELLSHSGQVDSHSGLNTSRFTIWTRRARPALLTKCRLRGPREIRAPLNAGACRHLRRRTGSHSKGGPRFTPALSSLNCEPSALAWWVTDMLALFQYERPPLFQPDQHLSRAESYGGSQGRRWSRQDAHHSAGLTRSARSELLRCSVALLRVVISESTQRRGVSTSSCP